MFLRTGWIVAEAGIGHAALIVLAAVALILVAVLAAIGICERCHVQSGGVYFLISHVLGSRRGAAVGVIYIFGQVKLNVARMVKNMKFVKYIISLYKVP